MKPLLIKDGRIIDPAQGIDRVGSLLVSETILGYPDGDIPLPGEYDILPAEGLVVSPGFIDLHCHLRQPGDENKETIASGTQAAARSGFTTVCAMPNTKPATDNQTTINYVKSVAAAEGAVRVLPIGCITLGRKGRELANLKGMASAGTVAFSDDGSPVMDSGIMRRALETAGELGLPLIDHCEDLALTRSGVINEGPVSARLGLSGMPPAAEEIMIARDLILSRITGAHIHIAHVSTARGVELIRRAKEQGIRVTAEVTPHHLTLTEDRVTTAGANAKVNPPLRTADDVAALVRGLQEGVIDAVATDHAPHTEMEKQTGIADAPFGISGLETALGSLMTLVHDGELTLPAIIAKLTLGPAGIINRPLGTLKIGAATDVTIFDPDKPWTVAPALFASRGKNTPLTGTRLKGKVMVTIYQGKLVYTDKSVRIVMETAEIKN